MAFPLANESITAMLSHWNYRQGTALENTERVKKMITGYTLDSILCFLKATSALRNPVKTAKYKGQSFPITSACPPICKGMSIGNDLKHSLLS